MAVSEPAANGTACLCSNPKPFNGSARNTLNAQPLRREAACVATWVGCLRMHKRSWAGTSNQQSRCLGLVTGVTLLPPVTVCTSSNALREQLADGSTGCCRLRPPGIM
mmetsp:Transcript_69949/g.138548  ORF Transcript_69949/g.138548 Transcript_69949/m.138548 type:complete len:108 (-) Transcript_69949:129-452(-)